MTREEKARAYDEALERARRIKNGEDNWRYSDLTEIIPALEEVFPELTESEDERIRKKLVEYHSQQFEKNRDQEIGLFHKDALAYLEKQKDINCLACDQHLKGYLAGRKVTEEEKQKEQKPVDLSEMMVHKEPYIAPVPTPMVADEQKPWSEEDERMIGRMRSVVNECASYNDALDVNGDYCEGDYAKLDSWLKSLSSNLKKKNENVAKLCSNEWSESDKQNINLIISYLDSYIEEHNDTFGADECKSLKYWLKSLRPSWKPSEEHLSALLAVFNDPNNIGSQTCQLALTDLYEQLKKL